MEQDEVVRFWEELQVVLSKGDTINSMRPFLSTMTPRILSETEFILTTENAFSKEWVEQHYRGSINEALFSLLGRDCTLTIIIADNDESSVPAPALQPLQDDPTSARESETPLYEKESPLVRALFAQDSDLITAPESHQSLYTASTAAIQSAAASSFIDETSTFESFIVGDSNDFAFGAARGVAESPGYIYNPLFIYGRSGLGKTHLLLAIKDYVNRNHPHMKVTYAQTSDFFNDFTSSLRMREWHDFTHKYRESDILLLDDVQYFEGKESLTHEMFSIFNRMKDQKKQIVLSADRAPNEINLDERFVSRFASGIITDIQPPSFETKTAIFENYLDYSCKKLNRSDLRARIKPEIIDYIIERSSSNIRELEGAGSCLISLLYLERGTSFQTLTTDDAEKIVQKVFMKNDSKRIDVKTIQQETEKYFKISHAELISAKRSQNISYPRQIAMYLSRTLTGESYPDIGRAFGGKDHTTVMYAVSTIEKKRQADRIVRNEVERLIDIIKN